MNRPGPPTANREGTRTMARSRTRNSRPQLTARGVAVVSILAAATVGTAVAVWGIGPVVLTAIAVYALRKSGVAQMIPTAHTALRGIAWGVAFTAALVALSGNTTAAGGPALGLALAAGLAVYLKATAGRRTRRRTH